MKSYDLLVIGSGPGGYVAALRGAQLGAGVAVVERASCVGGVCLNWGCIPTKSMLSSGKVLHAMNRAEDFGLSTEQSQPHMDKIAARAGRIVRMLGGGVSQLFKSRKVEVLQGTARLGPRHQVTVTGPDGSETTVQANSIIVATGARPVDLPGMEVDGQRVVNSNHMIGLTEQPKRLVVIGGGVIGCEFASLHRMLGSEVTIIELTPELLPGFDHDIAAELARAFKKRKIGLHLGTKVEKLDRSDDGVKVHLDSDRTLEADLVMVAVGRRPNVEDLGLDAAGVKLNERRHIDVDDFCRTSAPGIYAIGDVNGLWQLAHVASHQAIVAVEHALEHSTTRQIDRDVVPAAVYCEPEVGAVGLSENLAAAMGHDVIVGRFPIRTLGRAHAAGEIEGLYKVVADAETHQILGVHIISHEASELLHAATIALSHEATLESVAHTIHAHPTYGEAFMEACEAALGTPIHG